MDATHFIEIYRMDGVIEKAPMYEIKHLYHYLDLTIECEGETLWIWKIKLKPKMN